MTNTMTNGQMRKSLASQIDRLDSMLDGLGDGLNDAVVSAVKQAVGVAVQEAVRGVLNELLSNPVLLHKLHETVEVEQTQETSMAARVTKKVGKRLWQGWAWCCGKVKAACGWCGEKMEQIENAIVEQVIGTACSCHRFVRKVSGFSKSVWTAVQTIRGLWRHLLMAIGVGVACGAVVYFAGPLFGAVTGGMSGFVAASAVQTGLWFRQMVSMQTASSVMELD